MDALGRIRGGLPVGLGHKCRAKLERQQEPIESSTQGLQSISSVPCLLLRPALPPFCTHEASNFLSLSRIQSSNAFGPWSALVHTLYRPLFHSLSVPIYPSPSSLVQLQLSSCRIAVLPGFKSFVCVKTLFIVVNFRVQGLFGPLLFGSLTWLNRIENLQKRGKL